MPSPCDHTAPTQTHVGGLRPFGRDRLARMVVVGSFLTLFLLAGGLVALAGKQEPTAHAAENAFNSILPVLAGWVGTVLAFYFSSANQERTNALFQQAIPRPTTTPGIGGGVLASAKMIPMARILHVRDLAMTPPSQILLSQLRKDSGPASDGSPSLATRLMFVDAGVFKAVLHGSTLDAFVLKSAPDGAQTFEDLLKDPTVVNQICKLVVFVSATASLGDAKVALDSVHGAQDIIVTPTGNATEPMLGWLSNVDLIKALKVD